MREIVLWYNRNKKIIWRTLGILAAIVVIIQLLQWITVRNQKINQGNMVNIGDNNQSNLNTITLKDDKSTVTGESLSKAQTNLLTVIDKFVEYCNNGQTNEAYDLLSEECKSEMYPNVTEFQKNYYNKIFDGKAKNISTENWIGNIYKVKFKEDALSTGIYNSESAIQDYITIVEGEEDNYKLNINGYIGNEEINKSIEAFDVKIQALEKHQYMDFTTYTFEVKNGSKNTILLNDVENTDTMYLEDKNDMKYYAYMHELSEANMRVFPGETKKVTIKYYSKYSSTKKITNIIFSEIQLGGNEIAKFEINL